MLKLNPVNTELISVAAAELQFARDRVHKKEAQLQKAVAKFVASYPGSLREMAWNLGVSAAYLCDIRGGKRKVSAAMVTRLEGLKWS